MWTLNPAIYLKHAWEKTNSGWGKASLILFYLFIWLGILKTIFGVVDPTFLGKTTCYIEGTKMSSFEESMFMTFIRGMCLWSLAFLIYADKGGLHSWNVGFVTFFVLAWFWIAKAGMINKMSSSMYDECIGGLGAFMWIGPVWIVVAFVLILVDEKKGDSGTAGETQSLVV